ncbi:Hydrolase, alpha/beta fold family functionally coupled to Phosphoribulokinase [Lunatimonas lonarensis]|uniref:Hydrolase, alpha/beta fold family functionally coupled to Phosphoribulokinase n=1 Tax=Lunatimonas lonarensis TaxID=1232681 RepID=R7ZTQ2_9BACT|nr:alpha/beta fold hydrolase [Lunatimonas lonarensis]EON77521.1 Hydrolase, alpha/beta fold family functionally coupled to Phosphoribulokinase [Lunatimonas lonarensis]
MPVVKNQNYVHPELLLGGHLQTIVPSLFRKVPRLPFERERISTPDGDFLDLDWLRRGSQNLVVISHGLEGNSQRPYMVGMADFFSQMGYDVLNWNFRGCSGELNLQPIFYHSGATYDLEIVVRHACKSYRNTFLIGFSLGGNLTLKFLGESDPEKYGIRKAVAISVPLDLGDSADKLSKPGNWLYSQRFLKTLKGKVIAKAKLFPDLLSTKGLDRISTLRGFDDRVTGPLHGFRNASHYYESCSSIRYLDQISVPVLILNALNDPFLSKSCFPEKLGRSLKNVFMEFPYFGGHVGFSPRQSGQPYWSEKRSFDFIHFD